VKRTPTAAIRQDLADPSILLDGSTSYAYATGAGGKNVQVVRANAFEGPWTALGNDAIGSLPWWVDHGARFVWAPDVLHCVSLAILEDVNFAGGCLPA